VLRPRGQARGLKAPDSGFAREAVMSWCEANRVDFLSGLAKNKRLVAEVADELAAAEEDRKATGQPWPFSPRVRPVGAASTSATSDSEPGPSPNGAPTAM